MRMVLVMELRADKNACIAHAWQDGRLRSGADAQQDLYRLFGESVATAICSGIAGSLYAKLTPPDETPMAHTRAEIYTESGEHTASLIGTACLLEKDCEYTADQLVDLIALAVVDACWESKPATAPGGEPVQA